MTSYPEIADNLSTGMKAMAGDLPRVMEPFGALLEGATSPGALDQKTKELIAFAIAAVLRCDPCIAHHGKAVLRAGASREEIAEALGVAVLMGGGTALAYCVAALEAVDQFTEAG